SGGLRAAMVESEYGKMPDGRTVHEFTITNKNGLSARFIEFGGILVSLNVPDNKGTLADVVLGYDHLEDYLKQTTFFGALIGRYGNRISQAKFTLNGTEYKLAANNGPNTLHGGRIGFDKVLWTGKKIDDQTIELSYLSKDGEEGFPGNLSITVRY